MALPETMKAIIVHGVEDYRCEERPVPGIGPGEVLIRVLATGICASDVKTFLGARVWGSTAFDGQQVQRDYVLQDGDVVELKI